jgi:nitrite reductase/ring-hydroxylating ferredoxin subunit/uncharacterized membrane protein
VDLRNIGEHLDANASLDTFVDPLARATSTVLPAGPIKDLLHGVPIGHPLHPVLTDLPIGFWTSATVLDMLGGPTSRRAARTLVGLGVAAAVPTAVAGLADWSELNKPQRRSGVVHAVANVCATVLYACSYLARRRGWFRQGVFLSLAGMGAATAGGFLGGHLAFKRASGTSNATAAIDPADAAEWSAVDGALPAADGDVVTAQMGDTRLALVTLDGTPHALDAVCSHLGGPLDEGDVVDDCLRCPWHASEFRVVDGSVARGPATVAQTAYEVRPDGHGGLEAHRKPPR